MPDAGPSPHGLRLTRIRVYPLKGAAGFDLPETEPDLLGIPSDRRWMLADPQGCFVSQRTHPRLALIRLSVGGGSVLADAPGRSPIALPRPAASAESREVRVHGDRMRALCVDGDPSGWFSDFFGEPLTLVFFPEEVVREVDRGFAPGHRVGFADGYPLHIVSDESLSDLNRRLRKRVEMLRFRPNLVVAGRGPWEEDTWRELAVGEARLAMVKPCARCQVPLVDPVTGIRGREPMKTLGDFRKYQGKVYFGQNAVFLRPGGLRVGDEVRILKRGEARPPL